MVCMGMTGSGGGGDAGDNGAAAELDPVVLTAEFAASADTGVLFIPVAVGAAENPLRFVIMAFCCASHQRNLCNTHRFHMDKTHI